jgi:hypothetical protein
MDKGMWISCIGSAAAACVTDPLYGRSKNGEAGLSLIGFTNEVAIGARVTCDHGRLNACIKDPYFVAGEEMKVLGCSLIAEHTWYPKLQLHWRMEVVHGS